jgi:general secretion pathway protein F
MTAFQYQALDASGRKRKGVLSADTAGGARKELISAGLTPLQIDSLGAEENKQGGAGQRFSKSDLVLATRQISTLIETATPVEEALEAVAGQMDKPGVRSTLLAVRARVVEGRRFSDALAEHPKVFSELYRNVVAAGDTSGELGTVMSRLADMLEKNRAMMMKALTALIYPAVLMLVALGVISGLMVFVVPKIVEQFDTLGATLPWITRAVIAVSNFMQAWGLALLLVLVVAGLGFWQAMRMPGFRLSVDRFVLRVPVVGKLARGLDSARFARTLSTLFASGAPLLECLQASRRTLVNTDIKERTELTVTAVREGASLSAGIRKSAAFPAMLSYMVAAGERGGTLPEMLDKTATHMESEFDTAVTVGLRLLEPLIIVAMGLIVLVIVLAILIPILQLNTLVMA